MKTITVKQNQTIFDLAARYYGTCEAVGEILRNNPEIMNDKSALAAVGIDYLSDTDFYPDVSMENGYQLLIDTDSKLIKTSIVREITGDITTGELPIANKNR